VGLHRQHQARANDFAIQAYRACAANAVLATNMGSGEVQVLTQKVRKIEPRQDVRINSPAVDMKRD
jgi:hypothetical protein